MELSLRFSVRRFELCRIQDDETLEVSSMQYRDFLMAKQFRNNVM